MQGSGATVGLAVGPGRVGLIVSKSGTTYLQQSVYNPASVTTNGLQYKILKNQNSKHLLCRATNSNDRSVEEISVSAVRCCWMRKHHYYIT